MNAPRFFCDIDLMADTEVSLPSEVAHHATKVLRLAPGDTLTLFNGRGGEYSATLTQIGKREVYALLGRQTSLERESPLHLSLVQALQAGEKMDYTIQKAVELGVAAIYPVASRRSVLKLAGDRQHKREAHWRSVAISACEQCGRNQIPKVSSIQPLPEWLQHEIPEGQKLVLAPDATLSLNSLPPPTGSLTLLVGPEGGLEPQELETAQASGFIPIRLGPRVLRTETAGLAALAAIQMLWGDFRGG